MLIRKLLIPFFIFFSYTFFSQNAYIELAKYVHEDHWASSSVRLLDGVNKYHAIENGLIYSFGYTGNIINSTNGTTNEYLFFSVVDTLGNQVYLTFLPGDFTDALIQVDNGDAYIIGTDHSGLIQTTDGSTLQGGDDLFVLFWSQASIQSNALTYDYASYYGGSDEEYLRDVTMDNDRIYILLETESTDALTTNGSTNSGGSDLMLLSTLKNTISTNTPLVSFGSYCTYIGGTDDDTQYGNGLIVDNGNCYTAFNTLSTDIPVTNSSSYASLSGSEQGVVMKISENGIQNNQSLSSALEYCSYIESSDLVSVSSIAYGGSTIVCNGLIGGNNIPTTFGSTSSVNYGGFIFAITENNINTSNQPINTYALLDYSLDDFLEFGEYYDNNFYFTGFTYSPDFLSSDGTNLKGTYDTYVKKVPLTSLVNNNITNGGFQNLFGGSLNDYAYDLVVNDNGIHLIGFSYSEDLPVTNNTQLRCDAFCNTSNSFKADSYYANYCLDGYLNYATYIEFSTGFPGGIMLENNNAYVFETPGWNHNIFYTQASSIAMIQNAPFGDLSHMTKIKFLNFDTIANDTILPLNQTVCQYGTPQVIEGNDITISNHNLPLLYTDSNIITQHAAGAKYRWQFSDTPNGPWTTILSAETVNYLPIISTIDQYYRRQVYTVKCGDTIILATSNVSTVFVNNDLAPVVDAGGTFQTCPGFAVSIGGMPTVTGGAPPYTYNWDNGLSSTANPSVTPTESGIYTLTVTDALGCKKIDQAIVYALEANGGADVGICNGQPKQIGSPSMAGLSNVNFQWTPTTNLSCSNCPAPLASPTNNTIYELELFVQITGGGTCSTKDSVLANFISPPSNTNFAGSDTVICFGNSLTIGNSLDSGFSYIWSPIDYLNDVFLAQPVFDPGNISMPVPNPINYFVTATKQGCSFSDQIEIATIRSEADLDGCGPRYVGISDPTPNINDSFVWSLLSGPGNFTGPTNIPLTTVSASSGGSSIYALDVSYNGTTCRDVVEVTDCGCFAFGISSNIPEGCISYALTNDSIQLTVTETNGANLNYSWSPNTGLSNYNSQTVTLTTNAAMTYTVEITDPLDPNLYCIQSIDVNLPSFSSFSFELNDTSTCVGLPIQIGNPPIAGYDYQWTLFGAPISTNAQLVITPSVGGNYTYTLTMTDQNNGCTFSDTLNLFVEEYTYNPPNDWYVCENAIISIGGDGNPNFDYSWTPSNAPWQNGATANSPNPEVLIAASAQFTVIADGTTSNCTFYDTVDVFVDNFPTIPPMPDIDICKGSIANIGIQPINGANTYTWNPTTNISCTTCNQTQASPPSTETYTLEVDFLGNCQQTPTTQVTVNVEDISFSLSDTSYCPSDGPLVLGNDIPAGFSSYFWAPPVVVSNGLSRVASINVNTPTSLTVTVTNNNGCLYTDTVLVSPNIQEVDAGNNVLTCLSGNGVTIGNINNPVTGLSWSPVTGLSSPNSPTTHFNPTAIGTFTYLLTYMEGNCSITDSVIIDVLDVTANAGNDLAVCENACSSIGSTNEPNLSYSWNPQIGLSNPTISNPILCPTSDTIYTLTVTNQYGCQNQDQVGIRISDSIAPLIQLLDIDMCYADDPSQISPIITPNGNYNYSWVPVTGLSNPLVVNPLASPISLGTTNYTLTATNQNSGCSSEAELAVNVSNCPPLDSCLIPFTILSSSDSICSSNLLTINFISDSNDVTYNWTTSGINTYGYQNGSGDSIHQTLINLTSNIGEVTYVITPETNNCVGNSQSITVQVNSDSLCNNSIDSCTIPFTINITDDTICSNEITSISFSSDSANVTYSWNSNSLNIQGHQNGSGNIINDTLINPSNMFQEVSYTITPNINGCDGESQEIIIYVDGSMPSFSISDTLGCIPLSINLSSSLDNCSWIIDGDFYDVCDVNYILNEVNCIDLSLQGTDSIGCQKSIELLDFICSFEEPVAYFEPILGNLSLAEVLLDNQSTFSNGAEWYLDSILISNDWDLIFNQLTQDSSAYNFCLTATSSDGCRDTYCNEIIIDNNYSLYVPNTFSPNGDGFNDLFIPNIQGLFRTYQLTIFNRWGEMIFETDNPEQEWDGKHGNRPCQQGIYIWKLSFIKVDDLKSFHLIGHVNLIK